MSEKNTIREEVGMYTSRYNTLVGTAYPGGIKCRLHPIKNAVPLHLHDYYEVELVKGGEMEQSVNGVPYHSRSGDYAFMDLRSVQRIIAPKSPPTVWTLSISQALCAPAVAKLLSGHKFPIIGHLPPDALAEFDGYATALQALHINTPYSEERATALATLLLTMLLEYGKAPDAKTEEPRAHHYIQKALLYMNESYAEPLTLSSVASEIHISACYLSDLFSRIVGCRFVEYLTRLRLDRARAMLRNTDRSVGDVATACGFGTVSNFTRAFRRFYGKAPSSYRREGGSAMR